MNRKKLIILAVALVVVIAAGSVYYLGTAVTAVFPITTKQASFYIKTVASSHQLVTSDADSDTIGGD